MRSIAKLLGVHISVPDFSTLSRRGSGLTLRPTPKSNSNEAIHLAVDSTGLKIFGEGEWCEENHKNRAKRKSWRKLHPGLDLVSGEIICSDLTADDVGDPTALPDLLDQIDGQVDLFLANGAYDGSATRNLLTESFGASLEIVIPPPKSETFSTNMARTQPFAITKLPTSRPTVGYPGRKPPVTINAVVSRHKWTAGRLSSAPN